MMRLRVLRKFSSLGAELNTTKQPYLLSSKPDNVANVPTSIENLVRLEDMIPSTASKRFHPYVGACSLRVNCGELRSAHVGQYVEIVGRLQKQTMGRFVLLRDGHGSTQLVVPPDRTDLSQRFLHMPLHSYVSIIGHVVQRPLAALNDKMSTGEIEVSVRDIVMVKVNKTVSIVENGFAEIKRNYSTMPRLSNNLTSDEIMKCGQNETLLKMLKSRSVTCGGLTKNDVGREVTIIGWTHARNHLPRFLQLKDGYGSIQCLIPSNNTSLQDLASKLINSDIIEITGLVRHRPENQINMVTSNGDIELKINSMKIIDPNNHFNNEQSSSVESSQQIPDKNSDKGLNCFTWRTHTCGELRLEDSGKKVVLCGWLQHKRMRQFFTLRDSYGVTQCLIPNENKDVMKIDDVAIETILKIVGNVSKRPQNSVNQTMLTGEIEILVNDIEILNNATFAPIPVRSFQSHKEQLRLQYRYIDLRFPEMQRNLRIRSNMLMNMRKYLIDHNSFVEVETPTLFCRTPGGAQEFVVPTRNKDHFYSLVQSPQQFKQMLMAGAIDRYFQVARCYRDETVRGDRQPEFTQLDIELSFAGVNNIMALIEGLILSSWPRPLPNESFKKLTFREALERYGTDKPNTLYDLKFENLTKLIEMSNKLRDKIENLACYAFVIKNTRAKLSNTQRRNMCDEVQKKYKNVILKIVHESNIDDVEKKLDKLLNPDEVQNLTKQCNLQANDFIAIAIGSGDDTCWALGDVRLKAISNKELSNDIRRIGSDDDILWVVDFPLFTKGDSGQLETCHHPFTAPHPDDIQLLYSDPLKVRSLAYDLVINGNEVGGGSVRAHNGQLQRELLNILNIPHKPLQHFLNALDSGCPPHAGIALGIDRLVSIACNAESIRDVIAFPKSHEGKDPLSGAPAPISDEEKKIYHINS